MPLKWLFPILPLESNYLNQTSCKYDRLTQDESPTDIAVISRQETAAIF